MARRRGNAQGGRQGCRRCRIGIAGVLLVLFTLIIGVQAAAAATDVRAHLTAARDLLRLASSAAPASFDQRRSIIERVGQEITLAEVGLDQWPLRHLSALPLLGRDLRVAAALTASARDTVAATRNVMEAFAHLRTGRLNAAAITDSSDTLLRLATTIDAGARRIRATKPLLLERQRQEFLVAAGGAARKANLLGHGLKLTARLYGFPQPARIFLALQNPAELRGTGGLIGQYGILEGSPTGPRLVGTSSYTVLNDRVARLPRPSRAASGSYAGAGTGNAWSAVNLAPHLPAVGARIVELYRRITGSRLDGVIAVDPLAVAEILQVSGPITVGQTRIAADNVVDATLVQAYVRFGDDVAARRRFLGEVARAAFVALQRALAADPEALVLRLATAARSRHLQVYATDPEAERALDELGVTGSAAAPEHGDYFLPVGVNTAGNKLDAFLQRRFGYTVRLHADGSAQTKVDAVLHNGVRLGRLPRYVVGPYDRRFRVGENRIYQSLYLAAGYGFARATLDGRDTPAEARRDVGALTLSKQVSILPGRRVQLAYVLERTGAAKVVDGRMRYELLVRPQATVLPDSLEVAIQAPSGWRFEGVPDGARQAGPWARWSGLLDQERIMVFTLQREP
jgi:Protein of unknown function (DUF4012)